MNVISGIGTSSFFAVSAYSAGIATQDNLGNDITATYLSAVPEGYATTGWVDEQGYITSDVLDDYVTTVENSELSGVVNTLTAASAGWDEVSGKQDELTSEQMSAISSVSSDYVKYTDNILAIGTSNTATDSKNRYAFAFGRQNNADRQSIVMGSGNSATVSDFVAGTNNSAYNAHIVIGSNNSAYAANLIGVELSGQYWSVPYGVMNFLYAPFIIGYKNKTYTSAYFVIGNGDRWDGGQRRDVFIVSANGIVSAGDYATSSYSSINAALANITTLTAGTDLAIDSGIVKVNTDGTVANSAEMSFVAGSGTYASGIGAAAFGTNCSASGIGAFAMGIKTSAEGAGSFAEGSGTSAFGDAAHAEGYKTLINGSYAHVEGYMTSAYTYSHAEGRQTEAGYNWLDELAYDCHSEGKNTKARGNISHAEGEGTSALSLCTHAEGMYTIANYNGMHAGGRYNATTTNALFVIGNGTAVTARSDAFIISGNGYTSATNFGTSGFPDIDGTLTTLNQAISNVGSFEVVDLTTAAPIVPDVQDPDTKTIYLTKATTASVTDPYKEWIWTSAEGGTSSWECFGDTSIDLSNYYTKSQSDSRYCTTTTAQAYANYQGGNGIVVAGDVLQTKTINSNLTEVPLQDGTGISVYVDPNQEYVEIAMKPEVFLYQTANPITRNTDGKFVPNQTGGQFSVYNNKNGDVGVNNDGITGLDSSKLYNYNIKIGVTASSPSTVSLQGPNWNNSISYTSAYISDYGTLELDCYVKGVTGIDVSGSGLVNAPAGIIEVSVTEVCDV